MCKVCYTLYKEEDKKLILQASSKAEQAVKYILNDEQEAIEEQPKESIQVVKPVEVIPTKEECIKAGLGKCFFVVGVEGNRLVRCQNPATDVLVGIKHSETKEANLCRIHAMFVNDTQIKDYLVNGKYRDKKEIREIS